MGQSRETRLPAPFYSLHPERLESSVFEEGLRLVAVWASQLPDIERVLVSLAIGHAGSSQSILEKWPHVVSRVAANDNTVHPEVREFVLGILMGLIPSRAEGAQGHG